MWKTYVDSGEIGPLDKKGAQNPPNLTETELKIIEILKRDSPSMLLSKICDVADSYCADGSRHLCPGLNASIVQLVLHIW